MEWREEGMEVEREEENQKKEIKIYADTLNALYTISSAQPRTIKTRGLQVWL